jgi:hypothetical protein
MSEKVSNALTVGEIARQAGCPIHRIEYIIRSRGINPVQRAGIARVFTPADVDRITGEVKRIPRINLYNWSVLNADFLDLRISYQGVLYGR